MLNLDQYNELELAVIRESVFETKNPFLSEIIVKKYDPCIRNFLIHIMLRAMYVCVFVFFCNLILLKLHFLKNNVALTALQRAADFKESVKFYDI